MPPRACALAAGKPIGDIGYKPAKSAHPFGGPGAHNGGRIRFNPGDGFLYVLTGNNHSGEGPQHLKQIRGKVLRVDRDGRGACPDAYCGYSPNQMGAMPPAERSAFMPMTDLKAFPDALEPAWTNNGLSQGMCGSVFLVGKQWKQWEGRLAVGYAGIGIHGTPTGNRIDILGLGKDGLSAKCEELLWPTFAGWLRHLALGPDNALYVADEYSGMIYRVTPN